MLSVEFIEGIIPLFYSNFSVFRQTCLYTTEGAFINLYFDYQTVNSLYHKRCELLA